MTDSSSPMPILLSSSELELTIAQVQGIYAARVVSDRREPTEIHIVASTSRPPKRLVRDIETLVFVKHGIKIDYRRISLVQLEEQDLLRLPIARPEVCQVVEEHLGDQRRIRVEIRGAGKVVQGEALERIDHPMTLHTAARATISCLEQLIGRQMNVRLENAASIRLDAREVVLVLVTCWVDDREETFVGASFVGLRSAEAAARATLDALNRRILTLATIHAQAD